MNSMMSLDEELGRCAINEVSPAGNNPRDGAAFAIAQAQIDKLNNIHSQSVVDWVEVAGACTKILREEGKDLTVAVWLFCAWVSLRGSSGLVSGVQMLRGLIEQYWLDFTPPPQRLRARRNQAEWMLDWLEGALGQSLEPLEAEQLERLLLDWDGVDTYWRDQDVDGPCFFRLRRRLAELPLKAVVAPQPEPAVVEPERVAEPAEVVVPVAPRSVPEVVVMPEPEPALPLGDLGSDEAVAQAVNERLAAFSPLIDSCLQGAIMQPVLFRINRQMAWLTLEQTPMAQGGLTRLPPPPQTQVEIFSRVLASGEPLSIVRFCEERLVAYPFWLDLNRASHAALSRMGEVGAAGAVSVALETRHLLARLPTLGELSFADGQPFAEGATRSWLESLMPAVRGAGDVDAIQTLIDEASGDAAEGRVGAALLSLQGHVRSVGGGRERFRLRRAQCELLHRFDSAASLQVALEVLLQEAQAQGLERWEPELVQPLLELALKVGDEVPGSMWGKQMASMDFPALWRLAGNRTPAS